MAARPERDQGMAMLMVIGIMAVLTVFLLTSLGLALSNAPASRRDQDAKTAEAAAEAGVEDYLARLDASDSYWTLGNTGDPGNLAFSAAGRPIQGTGGQGASYRYQLLSTSTSTARDGRVRLQVTGTSGPNAAGKVSRTITATLQPKGFLQYIYLSDVEVVDPDLLYSFTYLTYNGQTNWNGNGRYRFVDLGPGVRQACAQYHYAGRANPSFTASVSTPVTVWDTWNNVATGTTFTAGTASGFSCSEITWFTGDVVQGPLHSNDALQVSGNPLFTDPKTESSWANPPAPAQRWWTASAGQPSLGTPSQPGYWPVYADPLQLPAGNSTLRQYVEPRADDPANPGPGCYYTGATRITFTGTTMKVYSPWTTNAPARCLVVANRGVEQTLSTIPPVIYVDATATCTSGSASGVGYPAAGEWTGGVTTDYDCHRGTAYVSGTVSGQVTVAGLDDVVITGDVLTQNGTSGTDVIGLVAGNYVWVYHPVDASGSHNNLAAASAPHQIQAAVLSLRHSFLVQNWTYGAALSSTGSTASKLNVVGSIGQKFRGPVGTNSGGVPVSGYLKNYVYDSRLNVLQPPYFLKPDSSPWVVTSIADR